MKKILIILYLIATFIAPSQAQQDKCLADFEYVVNRIKNDYPGYLDKVNQENIKELEELENNLRKKLIQYPDSCYKYMNNYTGWFKDVHLRVSNNGLSSNQNKELGEKKTAKFDSVLLANQKESIEGIWVGFSGNIAIVKQDNKYIGIAINLSGYNKNQVLFETIGNNDNEYDLITYRYNRNYKPRKEKATLFLNNSVFEIHNDTRFVRQTLDKRADIAFLLSYIPQYPNGKNTYALDMYLNDSTYYLRVPSFYSSLANDLVKKHWNEITARPNLIIDIRNNGGGQDNYYQKLAELIYTNPYESKGVEWFSTEQIILDWEKAIKNGGIKEGHEKESKALVEEMKKNIGGFVIHPSYGKDKIIKRDTIYNYPKRVGIIINGGNASSAEQFLLTAKQSKKVILFGNENTAGVLDYSNITPIELPSGKYNLWLPATRSRRLPENPIDNIGIAPDVYIPLKATEQLYNRLDDWVYYVKNYLEYNK